VQLVPLVPTGTTGPTGDTGATGAGTTGATGALKEQPGSLVATRSDATARDPLGLPGINYGATGPYGHNRVAIHLSIRMTIPVQLIQTREMVPLSSI